MAINHPIKGRIGDACFDYRQLTGARFGALVPLPLAASPIRTSVRCGWWEGGASDRFPSCAWRRQREAQLPHQTVGLPSRASVAATALGCGHAPGPLTRPPDASRIVALGR